MKVVINKCYGGFGLSAEAVHLYLNKKGLTFFEWMREDFRDSHSKYIPYDAAKDVDNSVFGGPTITLNEIIPYEEGSINFYGHDLERNDVILVEVVEEMGSEKASSSLAKLEVVEIPDGVEYEISEYDGVEWVAEKHRTWG